MRFNLRHQSLGTVTGNKYAKVIEYRGVQYATLDHKFADAVLSVPPKDGSIDATRTGPCAQCPPDACDLEYMFIQHTLPREQFAFSDTNCLNMNIVCPKDSRNDLPVFVYIHGGGFGIGSNAWPQYDLKRIVQTSVDQGSPIIGVGINYRLGLNGFLISESLIKAGSKPNRGLRDQQVAFEWLQMHIGGFGGDPNRVTAVAESAGAVGLMYLLQSPVKLFSQCLIMAGTPLLMKPLPMDVAEAQYQNILQILGLGLLSPEEAVQTLLNMKSEDLIKCLPPSVPLVPVIDRETVLSEASFSDWQNGQGLARNNHLWCTRMLIGDCAFDAHITYYMLPPPALENIEKDFVTFASKFLSKHPSTLKKLVQAYEMNGHSDTTGLEHVLNFSQDIGFDAPVRTIADHWGGEAFVYYFNEANPWDGKFKGKACHVLDIIFLLQNYNEYLSPEQIHSSQEMGKHFIEYVNGRKPFPAWQNGKGGAMVYGLTDPGMVKFVEGVDATVYGRRETVYQLAEDVGLDSLSNLWDQFRISR